MVKMNKCLTFFTEKEDICVFLFRGAFSVLTYSVLLSMNTPFFFLLVFWFQFYFQCQNLDRPSSIKEKVCPVSGFQHLSLAADRHYSVQVMCCTSRFNIR